MLFKKNSDSRGSLISFESCINIPFEIKRVYTIFNVPGGVKRGAHAHKKLKQVLVCITGSCEILVSDGINKVTCKLESPDQGLYLDGLLWREMQKFSEACVLMVFADEVYNEEDYIRDYSDFMRMVNRND